MGERLARRLRQRDVRGRRHLFRPDESGHAQRVRHPQECLVRRGVALPVQRRQRLANVVAQRRGRRTSAARARQTLRREPRRVRAARSLRPHRRGRRRSDLVWHYDRRRLLWCVARRRWRQHHD